MAPVTGPTGDSLVSYGGMAVRQARITNLDRAGTRTTHCNSLLLAAYSMVPGPGCALILHSCVCTLNVMHSKKV